MSQSNGRQVDIDRFLGKNEEVHLQDLDDPRKQNGQLAPAVARSNALLQAAWEARDTNLVPWIHISLRWRLLKLTSAQFAKDAGMKGYFAVRTMENPTMKRDLGIHDSAHASVAHFMRLQNRDDQPKELLEAGTERLIDALVEPYRLRTERLLLSERIKQGPTSFESKTAATKSLKARIARKRITPFNEMVTMMRGLYFSDTEELANNNPTVWAEKHIQQAYEAFVEDQISSGTPAQIAQVMAVVQFMGHEFTKDQLNVLGLTQMTRRALTQKQVVSVDRLKPLEEKMIATLGEEPTEEFYDLWSDESRKLSRRMNSSKLLRGAIANLNAEPSVLLPAFDIDPSWVTGHETMRSALERGPSKRVPLIALVHILATDEKELKQYEQRARSDLRKRKRANLTQASFKLPAELQYCGIEVDDLGFSPKERDEYAALQRGDVSTLNEKDILQRMYDTALRLNVIPTLRRWVDSQEPRDAASMFELLAMRKSRGIRELVKNATTSEATVSEVRRNTMQPQHALLRAFAKSANVILPAHVEIDSLLRTADQEKGNGQKPLGRAINALIVRTHRHVKTFRRESDIDISERTFTTYVAEALERGIANQKLLSEIGSKAESDDHEVVTKWLELLLNSDSEAQAFGMWIAAMEKENKQDYLDGLEHLQDMVKEKVDSDTEKMELDELIARNFQLHRWKYGKINPESSQKEDLSSPQQRAALRTLLLLPGISKEGLLSFSMEGRKERRENHTRRVVSLIQNAEPTDAKVIECVNLLMSGDAFTESVFYGDKSMPSSGYRVEVFSKRQELDFKDGLHLDEDNRHISSTDSESDSDGVVEEDEWDD